MKKIISYIMLLFTLFSCGVASKNADTFELAGFLVGTGDKINYYWQSGDGLMPYLLYRGLVISSSNFKEVKPDLAEKYEISKDEKTYTFTMKPNLKWSDGQALTAEDVKFSIEEALKVSLINGIFTEAFTKIEGAKDLKDEKAKDLKGVIVDKDKVTIKLTKPIGNFMNILAQFYILPKHCLEKENPLELHNSSFWSKPVTSGMYKVDKIQVGNYIELGINPNYEGTKPKIKKVVYNFVQDHTLAVQNGNEYIFQTNKPKEIQEISKIKGMKKIPVDALFYRYFIVNLAGIDGKGNSKLSDVRVRQALLYAIDKATLGNKLYPEVAKANYTAVPDGKPEELKDVNKFEFNQEKAKALLKEANYNFNDPLVITYYYKDQTSVDFMQAISYQLNQIGIKTKLVQIQSSSTPALFKQRKYDIAYKGFSSFGYESWYGEYTSNNVNFKNIYNGDTSFDALVEKLSQTSDETERNSILQQLQKLEQEKLYKLPLYTFNNYLFINENKVKIPSDVTFANTFYRYDYNFEKWELR